jgi:hypothetical protein
MTGAKTSTPTTWSTAARAIPCLRAAGGEAPECDPHRVRPECDPSEAFDVIKYRDNSCEMKKISFIQTTKYSEYT